MHEGAPSTRWIDGRIADREARPPGSAWAWMAAVLVLILAVDWALGLGSDPPESAAKPTTELDEAAEIRAQLQAAATAARAGRRSIVLVGDSVLAGDAMAERVPDWSSQRVVDHMRAELGIDSEAALHQVALDGLLPIDALHLLAELDRLDPTGEVEFVFELNLRYFSSHYANQRDCTRPELCALGRERRVDDAVGLEGATLGLVEAGAVAREWLVRRAPIHRHRPQLRTGTLTQVDGLTLERETIPTSPSRAQGLARADEHYRSSSLAKPDAQAEALVAIVERLRARGRPATLFLTPLEDDFADATMPGNALGRREERLAAMIFDRALPTSGPNFRTSEINLINLDHPLFGADYFLDHVHLAPAGNRLLALNLLHELGLPLRRRPFEWMMVHNEDHDRSLVHRRDHGYADGAAWRALFRDPEGVAVSRSGDWIVVADTGNHALRQLRGTMQTVERLAGEPTRPGSNDGPALEARLQRPRSPEIVGDTVYFIDGPDAERIRGLAHGEVQTMRWSGPRCRFTTELEARVVDDRSWLYLLCADDRVLALDLDAGRATLSFDPALNAANAELVGLRGLEPTDDGRLLLADGDSRIWSIDLDSEGRGQAPTLVFANTATELLPQEFKYVYPFGFDEMRVNRIVGMEWVDRYGALLIQDEHDLGRAHTRLQREETERVHLRLLDLDNQLVFPWIKAIPHADAFHMWNATTRNLVSYYHFGSMAVVQDDASLIYVERKRSRLLRLADGMLAVAKAGSLHTTWSKVELLQPIGTHTASTVSSTMRPDRFMSGRHEPIPRTGPYVALLIGSSFSTISDRLGNYSLGRLLELELQAELGYRDGIRLDLFQRTYSAASFDTHGNAFEEYLTGKGPPPDIVLFELHDFNRRFFKGTKTRAARIATLARIEQLAARYETLVIFYDNSAIEANRRDGLQPTHGAIHEVIGDMRKLGFVVLEPSDRLLRELLVESPWSNQPWGGGQHHGAPWAVELTAKTLTSMAYPMIREFLRGREPARLRERDPASFMQRSQHERIAAGFEQSEGLVNRDELPILRRSYMQRQYNDGTLALFVDLAGFRGLGRSEAELEAVALAVLYAELEDDIYGELAERVELDLLEFQNYDEYGEGVRESASVVWHGSIDRAKLEQLIQRVAARQGDAP